MLDSLVRVSRRVDKYYLKKLELKLMLSFNIIFKSFYQIPFYHRMFLLIFEIEIDYF